MAKALGSNVDQLHKKATVNAANIDATSLMPSSDENWVAKERRKLFSICSSPPPKKFKKRKKRKRGRQAREN